MEYVIGVSGIEAVITSEVPKSSTLIVGASYGSFAILKPLSNS